MTRYSALAIATSYWKPKENYIERIIEAVEGRLNDGDFLVVSEKALSIATGNIVDEGNIEPSLSARFLANFWMRFVWGYYLGITCGCCL